MKRNIIFSAFVLASMRCKPSLQPKGTLYSSVTPIPLPTPSNRFSKAFYLTMSQKLIAALKKYEITRSQYPLPAEAGKFDNLTLRQLARSIISKDPNPFASILEKNNFANSIGQSTPSGLNLVNEAARARNFLGGLKRLEELGDGISVDDFERELPSEEELKYYEYIYSIHNPPPQGFDKKSFAALEHWNDIVSKRRGTYLEFTVNLHLKVKENDLKKLQTKFEKDPKFFDIERRLTALNLKMETKISEVVSSRFTAWNDSQSISSPQAAQHKPGMQGEPEPRMQDGAEPGMQDGAEPGQDGPLEEPRCRTVH